MAESIQLLLLLLLLLLFCQHSMAQLGRNYMAFIATPCEMGAVEAAAGCVVGGSAGVGVALGTTTGVLTATGCFGLK